VTFGGVKLLNTKKTKSKNCKYKDNIFLPVDAVVEDTAHVREHKQEIELI